MDENKYISCNKVLPPNGVIVETKIDDADGTRNEQLLMRSDNLWFVPDGSMYVYYAPTHWRNVESPW
jgi:hypothetical protein